MKRWLRRKGLWVFGRVLPVQAATWFEHLVFTPRHPDGGERRLPPGADTTRLHWNGGFLVVHTWAGEPPVGSAPTVLLLHGWGSSAAGMAPWVEPLRAVGYRVVAHDAPAHGPSAGRRTNLVECAEAVRAVAETFGPLHAVVAHSFGGATAAVAAAAGVSLDRLVLLGVPNDLMGLTRAIGLDLGLPPATIDLMGDRFARRLGVVWSELETGRQAARLTCPLLVVHDHGDEVVPFRHAEAIVHAAAKAEFLDTRGLGHHGVLTDPAVHSRVLAFLGTPRN